jgi:hypothetical protein
VFVVAFVFCCHPKRGSASSLPLSLHFLVVISGGNLLLDLGSINPKAKRAGPKACPFKIPKTYFPAGFPGVAGAETGAVPFIPEKTELLEPEDFRYRIVNDSEVSMKSAAA